MVAVNTGVQMKGSTIVSPSTQLGFSYFLLLYPGIENWEPDGKIHGLLMEEKKILEIVGSRMW